MPDFIAGSLSAAAFCFGLATCNALTRLAAPPDLMEGSFLQYGAALVFAGLTWRKTARLKPAAARR